MQVRPSNEADVEAVWQIIEQARTRMAEQGIDQWQDGEPNRQDVQAAVTGGAGHVLEDGGNIAGFAVISFATEACYEALSSGSWTTTGPYASLHRVALADGYTGRGLAGRLFGEAVRLARLQGAASVRLDTHADNAPMRHAAQKHGFLCRGSCLLPGNRPRLVYEKIT